MQKIITLTGPSCSGKTTLQTNLVKNKGFVELMSTTTRAKRAGEVDGVNYNFVDKDSFERLIREQNVVQYVNFLGDYYGVTKSEAIHKLEMGMPIIIIVEPSGIPQFKRFANEINADFFSIYLGVNIDVALSRMKSRDAQSASLDGRIANLVDKEMSWVNLDYDLRINGYNELNQESVESQVVDFIGDHHGHAMTNNLSQIAKNQPISLV